MRSLALLAALALPAAALAEAQPDRFGTGGYFRVMTRPDFEGGSSKLGYWNLYGRLLNEGPYGALELKLDVLRSEPAARTPWAAVHARIEGGSVANVDAGNGNLSNFRLSQLYVLAGNVLFDHVTWQLGTLESYYGDLGLYDMRPADVFYDTVGLSMRYRGEVVELLLGVGDSGFAIHGPSYDTVFAGGGTLKLHLSDHVEIGGGGQVGYEPATPGNRYAPYYTPGVAYADSLRHEVVKSWLEAHPGQEDLFPKPVPTAADSGRLIAYLGFGGFGPLRWNNFFGSYVKKHPTGFSYVESYEGRDYTIYTAKLTDEVYSLLAGDEMQLTLWPGRLDAVLAALYGFDHNERNTVAAGEDNRAFYSAVLRLQLYLTDTVHWLTETSVAQETSLNGNLYREHADSIFENTAGTPDARGLEYGDTNVRHTWQLKAGFVLNPTGKGIYTRPSLRVLYGLQYSNQQAAFGNGFVQTLADYNQFPTAPERHWHSVVAIEAEQWF